MLARLWIIPASVISTLFPAFSRLQGEGSAGEVPRLITRSLKYLLLTLGPLLVLLAVNGHDILRLWLGPSFAARATPVLQLLALGTLINFLAAIPVSAIQAMGRADLVAKLTLIQVTPYVALVWALVERFGLVGAALAWVIRVCLASAVIIVMAARVTGISREALVEDRLPQGILVVALYAAGAIVITTLVTEPWIRVGVLASSLPLLAYWIWRHLLGEADRSHLGGILRTVRSR
jgi:O-antigen/teichoic acid export membrane protein